VSAAAGEPAWLAPARAHLTTCGDPVIAEVVRSVEDLGPRAGRAVDASDHYGALVRAIVGQQLSTKAARSIYERLCARFGGRTPTPKEVLADDEEELRAAAGLSRAKVGFLRSLAEHIEDGSLELERMNELSDEEVIAELTAVKGIGEWTAHMFLIFHLERPDVMAPGDLGIRSAIRNAYGMDALPAPSELIELSESWRPHRSAACRFLWRSLDATPDPSAE
jgi:DNA-3-methyladenine glycosylase II